MDQNFILSLFTLCYKLLCDYFKNILKKSHFYQHQISKTNFEIHIKLSKVLVKRH